MVFEGAGNGMATVALDGPEAGRILRVNDAFCQITGYAADRLVGVPAGEFLRDEEPEQTRRETRPARPQQDAVPVRADLLRSPPATTSGSAAPPRSLPRAPASRGSCSSRSTT